MPHIIRTISRPSPERCKRIAGFTPATLHEAQDRRGALDYAIKPIYPGLKVSGPAVTVQCAPGDNMMLIAAIEIAEPGDVLVVAAGGLREQGGFGEVLATACRARGIAGLVIDAGVRDGEAIRTLGFPVFSTGLAMRGTVKETLGLINKPIVIGGIAVRPGDIIAGDDDGVVLVRQEEIDTVCDSSQAREDKEASIMAQLREGSSILALSGMGAVLERKGCVWE